jgi:predicted DNA binding CopG/RHH family protein
MNNKITIRISDELRGLLDEKALLEGISTSELARTILDEYCNKEDQTENEDVKLYEPEITVDYKEEYFSIKEELDDLYEEEFANSEEMQNLDVVYSIKFLQLVCWIYYQRSGVGITATKQEYESFKKTLIKIHSSSMIDENLKNEFDKVFADIVTFGNKFLVDQRQLKFAEGIFPNFAYNLLDDFIFKKNCGIKAFII